MLRFKVLEGSDFEKKNYFGRNHYCYRINHVPRSRSIIATMCQVENVTNLEILKFALWCRKNDTKLTMYGFLNQLPLFSVFADEVILQDSPQWATDLYAQNPNSVTTYYTHRIFSNFNGIELDHPAEEDKWPDFLTIADKEISDDEVAEQFKYPLIHIRQNAIDAYDKLSAGGIIKKNLIMCEVKTDHCGGNHLLSIFDNATKNYPLPISYDLPLKLKLSSAAGQDYMSVQLLASALSNWMWICYGGSSSIFPFFPVKILSLSDAYCRHKTIRKLFNARFPQFSDIFPEFETLIFCFPGEKDGPSRKDGHKPLPNLQKLTKDFSDMIVGHEIWKIQKSILK